MFKNARRSTSRRRWRVDKVTHMGEMFYGAASFDQPLGDWQVDQVTDMRWMFADANVQPPLGDWSVDNVGDFEFMFEGATSVQPAAERLEVAKVTNMRACSRAPRRSTSRLDAWSVGGVTNMQLIFNGASAFDQDLGWCVDTSVTTNNAADQRGGGGVRRPPHQTKTGSAPWS